MYRRIAIALLLIVFTVNVYRAETQSITADEAFSHSLFLTGSLSRLFDSYDASHHVLYSILAKFTTTIFGLTEFTLRLPSVLGGLLYLWMVFRLSRRLSGEGPLLLLSVALLSLNPHLMDFMSAARGYGMALALFLWALDRLLVYFEAEPGMRQPSWVYQAAIGLALSVSANLTLLIPAASLAAITLLVLLLDRELGRAEKAVQRLRIALDEFVIPLLVTAFVILILPLSKARPDQFYIGEPTARKSLESMAMLSLFHHPLPGWMEGFLPGTNFWYPLLMVLVPLVLAAAVLACLTALLRWRRRKSFGQLGAADHFLLLLGAPLVLSVVLLGAAHVVFRVPLPHSRTGLYLIPLFFLTAMALWVSIRKHRLAAIGVGLPLGALALFFLIYFLANFQTSCYGEWRFDRSTKHVVQLIRARQASQNLSKVRLGASRLVENSLNFYRRRYRLAWMEPVEKMRPDAPYDYYVLLLEDQSLVDKRGLPVLYSDSFSGETLAVAAPVGTR